MTLSFAILAGLTLAAATAAMTRRNLVHAALWLVVAFAGLAGLYLQLAATFVGLVQVLVYVGAVSILIVFAILLTRGGGVESGNLASAGGLTGLALAGLVLAALVGATVRFAGVTAAAEPSGEMVRRIGESLMTEYVLPLEVAGLLLTAALLGAVLLAGAASPTDRRRPPDSVDRASSEKGAA